MKKSFVFSPSVKTGDYFVLVIIVVFDLVLILATRGRRPALPCISNKTKSIHVSFQMSIMHILCFGNYERFLFANCIIIVIFNRRAYVSEHRYEQ